MHGKKNDCRPKSYLSFSCLGELKILLLNPVFMLCTIKTADNPGLRNQKNSYQHGFLLKPL